MVLGVFVKCLSVPDLTDITVKAETLPPSIPPARGEKSAMVNLRLIYKVFNGPELVVFIGETMIYTLAETKG